MFTTRARRILELSVPMNRKCLPSNGVLWTRGDCCPSFLWCPPGRTCPYRGQTLLLYQLPAVKGRLVWPTTRTLGGKSSVVLPAYPFCVTPRSAAHKPQRYWWKSRSAPQSVLNRITRQVLVKQRSTLASFTGKNVIGTPLAAGYIR